MGIKTIETAATTVWRDPNGILVIRTKGVYSTLESVGSTFDAARTLLEKERCPLLFDARGWPGGDAEAWVNVIATLPELFTAVAMVVDDSSSEQIATFAAAIGRLVIPSKSFRDEEKARESLDSYLAT